MSAEYAVCHQYAAFIAYLSMVERDRSYVTPDVKCSMRFDSREAAEEAARQLRAYTALGWNVIELGARTDAGSGQG